MWLSIASRRPCVSTAIPVGVTISGSAAIRSKTSRGSTGRGGDAATAPALITPKSNSVHSPQRSRCMLGLPPSFPPVSSRRSTLGACLLHTKIAGRSRLLQEEDGVAGEFLSARAPAGDFIRRRVRPPAVQRDRSGRSDPLPVILGARMSLGTRRRPRYARTLLGPLLSDDRGPEAHARAGAVLMEHPTGFSSQPSWAYSS